ncbi:MAG: DUF4493 domain-containing protein [Candidatus Cryptobacteroides sp.]
MRRIRFIPAMLAILCVSCSEHLIVPVEDQDGIGTLRISLTSDTETGTKADGASGDDLVLDDFRLAIYKTENQMRLYNDSYANTVDRTIKLNAGEYRLVAQLGDSLGCGFDKPYYLADPTFTIKSGEQTLKATAKMANVRMSVVFDESITGMYTDYYAIVRHSDYKTKKVKFAKDETRYGYIPGGALILEVYVTEEGVLKRYTAPATEFKPNDAVTFEITTDLREGGLLINLTIDNSVDRKDESITVPGYTIPQDAPGISLAGFDNSSNVFEFVEGFSADGVMATASFIAKAEIAHCYLDIESIYLNAKDVSGTIDFANLDSGAAAVLRNAGFGWDENMLGTRTYSYIDFSKIIKDMITSCKASKEDNTLARFTLTIEDAVGKTATRSFSIVSLGVDMTIAINDYDVWATKIVSETVTFSNGIPSLIKLQASTDGVHWTDCAKNGTELGNSLDFGRISLGSDTKYYIRANYNGGTISSNVVTITTESEAQVGNAGFEDYQLVQTQFTPAGGSLGGGTYTRNWYLPYKSGETDPWWACNSRKSMPDGHTGWTSTWCKNFPSSGYVKDAYSGSKSALVFSVNVGNANTNSVADGNTTEGELWIGTADDSGNRTSEGHSFTSRPSSLTFWYKYDQHDSETFYVYSWIKDAEGQVIATAEETSGPAADEWTKHSMTYTYTATDKKAASIYILFRSCNGEGSVSTQQSFELGEETVTAHAGSMFKIDDIELIYE